MCATETTNRPASPKEKAKENNHCTPQSPGMTCKSLLEDDDEEVEEEEEEDKQISTALSSHEEVKEQQQGGCFGARTEWEGYSNNINCSQVVFPVCQGELVEQIELMTQCRHPLDFLSIFQEQSEREGVESALPPGMYALPKKCEYCGSESTDLCAEDCGRPKSLFRKQRPPFYPPESDKWDPITDYEIPKKHSEKQVEDGPALERQSSLFAGFFGSTNE